MPPEAITARRPSFGFGVTTVSQLLDQAVEEGRKLSGTAQDAIAQVIMDEIADDQRWEQAFARSPGKRETLAARAEEQVRSGQFKGTGFGHL